MTNLPIARQGGLVKANNNQPTAALELYHQFEHDYWALERGKISDEVQYATKYQINKLPALRERWARYYKAASRPEIATVIALMLAAFPTRADLDLFAQIAATEIRALRPSSYALMRTCSQVVREYEFPSIPAFVSEVKAAKQRAKTINQEMTTDGLAKELRSQMHKRLRDALRLLRVKRENLRSKQERELSFALLELRDKQKELRDKQKEQKQKKQKLSLLLRWRRRNRQRTILLLRWCRRRFRREESLLRIVALKYPEFNSYERSVAILYPKAFGLLDAEPAARADGDV